MRKAILSLLFATFLLALVFPQVANADDWDKKTIVTFNQDVAIPGPGFTGGHLRFQVAFFRLGSFRSANLDRS